MTTFRVRNVFEALNELSDEITAYENSSNESFPFVTPSIFELHASHTREQSGVEAIRFTPFVAREQFEGWNEYSAKNRWWYDQSKRIIGLNISGASRLDTSVFRPGSIPPYLTEKTSQGGVRPASPGRARYSPTWMMSPPPLRPDALNLDSLALVDQKWSPSEVVRGK